MQAWAALVTPILFSRQLAPTTINSLIVVPILFIATLFSLAKLSSNDYNKSFRIYLSLRDALGVAAQDLENGLMPNLDSIPALEAELAATGDKAIRSFQRVWILWLFFAVCESHLRFILRKINFQFPIFHSTINRSLLVQIVQKTDSSC